MCHRLRPKLGSHGDMLRCKMIGPVLRTNRGSSIIRRVPQTHTTKALANPAQPHKALMHELERYIEAHNPNAKDVNVVSATDTGQADPSHKPVRHWYQVGYEA
jgi:hypothetical protein